MTCVKEENFTRAIQLCINLLKCKENMLKVVFTDRDTVLMNVAAKTFPTSTALVCK